MNQDPPRVPLRSVTVLGLGAMGSRLASRLLEAGHDVTVWNRSDGPTERLAAAGAIVAATPAAAVRDATRIVAMLRDDDASRAVWLGSEGAAAALRPDAIAVEASTLTGGCIIELAAAVRARGAHLVEAPVVGSRPQAEAGQLLSLAAGGQGEVEAVRDLLAAYSARTFYLGEHGRGAAAKLAVNAFFATQVAAAAEALRRLQAHGIDDGTILELFGALPITPPPIAGAMQGMAAANFAPLFPIELVAKDLGYASDDAAQIGCDAPLSRTVRALFDAAVAAGDGADNIHGIVKRFESR